MPVHQSLTARTAPDHAEGVSWRLQHDPWRRSRRLHVVKHCGRARRHVEPGEVEDVVMGCAMPERATGPERSRGCRRSAPACRATVSRRHLLNRFCSSGWCRPSHSRPSASSQENATSSSPAASKASACRAGRRPPPPPVTEEWLMTHKPEVWMPMIETADIVAERYGVSRQAQDEYSLEEPAPHRRRPAGRKIRRRDRAAAGHEEAWWTRPPRPKATSRSTLGSDEGNCPRHHARSYPRGPRPSARKAASSRPATRASSPTAPRPAC